MTKIYLASRSKARKLLLDNVGLKCEVLGSRIKEKRQRGKLSYAGMVKRNALAKAKDVAARVKSGIIIGADTIVVQDGKIFGKPKDLAGARRMLKRLSAKPQLLYTGIAVIKKAEVKAEAKGKAEVKVASEKTRVYMDKLTDKEIEDYFRCVNPLTMAGSFDIQGKGAYFIRRIEGCFYNVVGLPLHKLYRMLKEFGVKTFFFCLFTFAFCLFTAGCSTEYNIVTGEQETYFYSTEKEVNMGRSVSAAVEKEYKLVEDPLVQHRVESIGEKIVEVCDRKDIDYTFRVIDEKDVNAVSLPGGYVYVFKGLIDTVENDDELAAVLAHEVAHIVARHSIKKLQGLMGYSLLRVLFAAVPEGGAVGATADAAFTQLMLGYSREDELLADELGAKYSILAGYDPRAMITFLEKLQEKERRKPLRPKSYFKTHPYVPDRIRTVKQEIGEPIGFTDYINIEQLQR